MLSGTIPPALCNLRALEGVDLSDNSLSGTIPTAFGNLAEIVVFDLASNSLSGTISPSLGNLTSLRTRWTTEGCTTTRCTTKGCTCRRVWTYNGQTINSYCGNPDDYGSWCFVTDSECGGTDWGLCAPVGTDLSTTSTLTVLRLFSNFLSGTQSRRHSAT